MEAELLEKKVGKKTGYLKYFVPEVNDIKEISLARNKFDDAGKLTERGRQAVRQMLEEMVDDPEPEEIREEEKRMQFNP